MILVTGGLGFVGAHTTRALLDLGADCVVGRYRADRRPPMLAGDLGTRVRVEPLDCADPDALGAIGARYPITGIVHLAAAPLGHPAGLRNTVLAALNVARAAAEWSVTRATFASTIGVYGG